MMITTAMTNRMWMKPPRVYEETSPTSQSTIKMTAIVHSIVIHSPK
jgi:hypothetical protein